jgi:hypothetical protein
LVTSGSPYSSPQFIRDQIVTENQPNILELVRRLPAPAIAPRPRGDYDSDAHARVSSAPPEPSPGFLKEINMLVTPEADAASANTILQLAGGAVLPRCLHAIANLGVADALGEIPETAASLAAKTGTHPDALARALRLLAASGVFAETDGRFSHTGASRLLRADHPHSLRPLARMFGLRIMWTMGGEVEYSIRTGLPSGEHLFEGGPWAELARDPEANRLFDEAMTSKAHGQVPAVLASYDFTGARTIADIGGGRGHLLRAVLDAHAGATGVLFDQPHVVEQVVASDRLQLRGGDFFRDDLPAADVYMLMEVIHDWDDERSGQILGRIRAAARPGARVLLIENLIQDEAGPSWPLTLDLWMLNISGKQRTLEEYSALFARTGFEYARRIDTPAGVSIVEAVAS